MLRWCRSPWRPTGVGGRGRGVPRRRRRASVAPVCPTVGARSSRRRDGALVRSEGPRGATVTHRTLIRPCQLSDGRQRCHRAGTRARGARALHTRRKPRWTRELRRWRDPDSNRGHHDFQSCFSAAQVRGICRELVPFRTHHGSPCFGGLCARSSGVTADGWARRPFRREASRLEEPSGAHGSTACCSCDGRG